MHYVYQIYVSAYIVAIRKNETMIKAILAKNAPQLALTGEPWGAFCKHVYIKKNERAWLSIDYFKTIIYSLVISFQYMYTNNNPYEIY